MFGSSAERTQCANATSVSEYNPKGYVALTIECRGMEQSVARRAHNPKVVGSSPTPATTIKDADIASFFIPPKGYTARRIEPVGSSSGSSAERTQCANATSAGEYNPKVVV